MFCDGASYSKTTYFVLFNVIGSIYRTATSTNIYFADLRVNLIKGVGLNTKKLTNPASGLGEFSEQSVMDHCTILQ